MYIPILGQLTAILGQLTASNGMAIMTQAAQRAEQGFPDKSRDGFCRL